MGKDPRRNQSISPTKISAENNEMGAIIDNAAPTSIAMGKVCIVTGGSRGFGRGIALILAKEHGCTVYATARDLGKLQDLADQATIECAKLGSEGKVVPCQVDQKDDAAVKAFVEDVTAKEGKIDLLVNSAFQGLVAMTPQFGKTFWQKPLSMYEAEVDNFVRFAYVMSYYVAPVMVKNKSGLILGISSAGGVVYFADVAYCAGKAAFDKMHHDMACELREHGVFSMTLYPQAGITENANFPGGDTPSYAGRAVAALMNASEEDMTTLTGKVIQTREVADKFGFTDVDGKHPDGPFTNPEAIAGMRKAMRNPPHLNLDSPPIDPDGWKSMNAEGFADMFPGYKA